jgi:cytochrome c
MIKHDVASTFVGMLVGIGVVLANMSAGSAQSQRTTIDRTVPLHAPNESTIPEGPVGTAVRYGKKVLTDTQTYARAYVGNGLNCSSCHLDAGRRAYSSPWVGLWACSRSTEVETVRSMRSRTESTIASNVR